MFDLGELAGALRFGRVARVVIAGFQGHSPREVGASMLVWQAGQSGTIGGGALEFQAVRRARGMLVEGGLRLDRTALGPTLGQCCGGVVTLLTEVYDAVPPGPVVARGPGAMPLAVKRILAAARGQGVLPVVGLVQGWMVEPVLVPMRQVWVWGAGHVGRALVSVLAPLPGLAITWVDFAVERFPEVQGVRVLPVAEPERAVGLAPLDAEHLIVTYSHALDLELCHRLLGHGFGRCGLIGSATKSARFRGRLAALGHGAGEIARIDCPIGDTALGKHPQAIAVGVAAGMLRGTVAWEAACLI